jgi:superfamily II DNA or RNA helicase
VTAHLTPALSPHGRLLLVASDDVPPLDAAVARRLIDAFERGPGHGLLQIGGAEIGEPLPPALSYWRELGTRYVTAICTSPDAVRHDRLEPPPPPPDLETLALGAPAMPGAEYINAQVLAALWHDTDAAFRERLAETRSTVEQLLKALNPAWNVVGRVHFNLAFNARDEEAPFAFLATYTHQLSAHGRAQHVPLGDALREYAGARNRDRMLALLLPVQRAADRLDWLREMVDAGEIFHPLRWTAADAFRFLSAVPELEHAGVIVRVPADWSAKRAPRPQVTATVGSRPPAGLGTDALVDFRMELSLDGERLTADEIETLLSGARRLALVRGRWIEVDPEQLRRTVERFRDTERLAAEHGLSFADAARLLSGADITGDRVDATVDPTWSRVTAGPWLASVLADLRAPGRMEAADLEQDLHGTLREYQQDGVRWLRLLTQLGLGACLADDMGLGKTIQVLALLLGRRRLTTRDRGPSLIVAPASLLANWQSEMTRFAPTLRAIVVHPSAMGKSELEALSEERLAGMDVVITSYGFLLRAPFLRNAKWDLVILDEAQAIKNPGAKQTRAAKQLGAHGRIALTGTPVENRLSDLWSIFDFINPGLLGSAREFNAYSKRLAKRPHDPYGPLRALVRPYVLRRLKTDPTVIADLPEKTEVKAYCQLTRKQAGLYEASVRELREQIAGTEGIRRRGLVLAFLMRFKQICNHPSQWSGDGSWDPRDSGKLARLRSLVEVIAAKQEKVLVFTQFREMTSPLALFLGDLFGRPGLVLHGGTQVRKRRDLVQRFQEDEMVPFFVISLKAGGSGLNLTAASHVIHFDRWWNPAVENQATDRAFRIGQKKNVLVHKFVCRGTVEEKIDQLIESKTLVSSELLDGGGAELDLTAMSDDELVRLVSLDLSAAMEE